MRKESSRFRRGSERSLYVPSFTQGQSNYMEKMQEQREVGAWMSVFQKTDRILTERRDLFVVNASTDGLPAFMGDVAGWTDGDVVYINQAVFLDSVIHSHGDDRTRGVAAMIGVNYHEVSHALFTPSVKGQLANKVIARQNADNDPMWWWCFNALEDMRAEHLFWTMYGEADKYFKVMILEIIFKAKDQDKNTLYPLIHGRRYLPLSVRRDMRERFMHKSAVDDPTKLVRDIGKIIDRYMVLDTTRNSNTDQAMKLIVRLRNLLKHASEGMNGGQPMPNHRNPFMESPLAGGHGKAQPGDGKSADGSTVGTDLSRYPDGDIRGGQQEMNPPPDKNRGSATEDDGLGEQAAPAGSQSGHFNGPRNEDEQEALEDLTERASDKLDEEIKKEANEESGESGDDPGPEINPVGSDSNLSEPGSDAGTPIAPTPRDEMLNKDYADLLTEAVSDASLVEHISRIQKAAKDAYEKVGARGMTEEVSHVMEFPTDTTKRLVRDVGDEFRNLQLDLEPAWHSHQPQGRLDAHRASQIERTLDLDVFDIFDEGNEDEGGVELVIAIDLSSSMNDQMPTIGTTTPMTLAESASEMAWAIKRVMDNMSLPCTVLTYTSGTCSVAYEAKEKAKNGMVKRFRGYGGTNPVKALRRASEILQVSEYPHRILLNITDGQWGGADASDAMISLMRQRGVTTVLIGLQNAVDRNGHHECEFAGDVSTPAEVTPIIVEMIEAMMMRAGVGHRDL